METSHTGQPEARLSSFRDLASSILLYIDARMRLMQIEASEAGGRMVTLLILAVIGIVALVLTWLMCLPVLVWFLANHFNQPWPKMALFTAGGHLLIAIISFLVLKTRISRLNLLEETRNQFQKDREWLSQTQR